jgi:hypothetical protein
MPETENISKVNASAINRHFFNFTNIRIGADHLPLEVLFGIVEI